MNERDQVNIAKIRQYAATGILTDPILKRAESIFNRPPEEPLDVRLFKGNLTLRVLSLYTVQALSNRDNVALKTLLNDCLPPRMDLKSLTNGSTPEEFFASAVSTTLERLWDKTKKQFPDVNRQESEQAKKTCDKRVEQIAFDQWWEVNNKMDGFTSKEWQIMIRCATLQLKGEELGTIINSICHCFKAPTPVKYQDAPLNIANRVYSVGRPGRHRRQPASASSKQELTSAPILQA